MKLRQAVAAVFVLQLAVGVSSAEAQRRSRNVITQEEIEKSSAADAFDLIRKLRPAWLSRRGLASTGGLEDGTGIPAYLDGIRLTGGNDLSTIGVERINEIRYLSANDATTKYGTGHTAGAIEIITKR